MRTSVESLGGETAAMEVRKLGRLLLGQQVRIGVSDPWDFEGPSYEGGLRGRIVDAGRDEGGKEWIALEIEPFDAEEGVRITRLVARGRYAEERDIVRQVADGASATVNLSYADQVPEEKRLPEVSPKLIGSVELA